MLTVLFFGVAAVVVFGVMGAVLQLMLWGVVGLAVAGVLGVLVVSPDVEGLFPLVRWLVIAWACATAFRWGGVLRRA